MNSGCFFPVGSRLLKPLVQQNGTWPPNVSVARRDVRLPISVVRVEFLDDSSFNLSFHSVDGRNPAVDMVNILLFKAGRTYMSGGAGILPSTVGKN